MLYIRKLRQDMGLTLAELGEIVGVSESAVGQYETGKRKPSFEVSLKLGEALHCSTVDLFREESEVAHADDDYTDLIEELQILRDLPETRSVLHTMKNMTPEQIRKMSDWIASMKEI